MTWKKVCGFLETSLLSLFMGIIYLLSSSNSSSSHFELVSLVLALEAIEPVSEMVTQMAVELMIYLISVKQKR